MLKHLLAGPAGTSGKLNQCICQVVTGTAMLQTVSRPTGVDDAINFVWSQPDTLLNTSEKQNLTAVLANKTDAVASRYFFAPDPEQWVGTLRELLAPTGNMSVCNQSWLPFHKASEHTHCS